MPKITDEIRLSDGTFPTHAWPGGYPLYYLSDDGQVWCPECANLENAEPEITHYEVNYEDPELYCDGCGALIESAYGY